MQTRRRAIIWIASIRHALDLDKNGTALRNRPKGLSKPQHVAWLVRGVFRAGVEWLGKRVGYVMQMLAISTNITPYMMEPSTETPVHSHDTMAYAVNTSQGYTEARRRRRLTAISDITVTYKVLQ